MGGLFLSLCGTGKSKPVKTIKKAAKGIFKKVFTENTGEMSPFGLFVFLMVEKILYCSIAYGIFNYANTKGYERNMAVIRSYDLHYLYYCTFLLSICHGTMLQIGFIERFSSGVFQPHQNVYSTVLK